MLPNVYPKNGFDPLILFIFFHWGVNCLIYAQMGEGHDCIIRSGRVMTLLSEPANSIPILMSLPPSDNKANIWNNIYSSPAIELSICEYFVFVIVFVFIWI